MILRPVRPQSPSGPPMTNLPVGLTCQIGVGVDPVLGQRRAHDRLDDLAHVVRGERLVEVLGRDDDRRRPDRLAVVVGDGHLALGVGAELRAPRRTSAPRSSGLQDAVRVVDRRRHQFRRLAAGIAEHDALVAGALVLVAAGIDALGDVGRLGVEKDLDRRPSSSGSRPARSRCRGWPCGRDPRCCRAPRRDRAPRRR